MNRDSNETNEKHNAEVNHKSGLNRKRKPLILLAASAVVLAILIFAGVFGGAGYPDGDATPSPSHGEDAPITGDKTVFESGTLVDGLDISNMSFEQAKTQLQKNVDSYISNYRCVLMHKSTEYVIDKNDLNITCDIDSTLNTALSNGAGSYSLVYELKDNNRLQLRLSEISEEITLSPLPPELVVDCAQGIPAEKRFQVTPPVAGYTLDTDSAVQQILSGAPSIELPLKEIPLDDSWEIPTKPVRLCTFSTSFATSGLSTASRVHNITKAAGLINGTVVAPMDEFSCNEVLGVRSEEAGWLPAPAFIKGGKEMENQFGGGICQVSTTLYNTVLRSNLQIVYRQGHSKKVSYIGGGMDAAISGDSIDFVWRNDTDSDVYVFMWVNSERLELCCEIYGEAFGDEFDRIDIVSELTDTVEPSAPTFTVDDSLPIGSCVLVEDAVVGRIYKSYKIYYLNNTEVGREFAAETYYLMHPAVYAVSAYGDQTISS